ncbi:Ig-like domain repeat protein [Microbacterium sp.]|uniref:Ig-like domain repeat protein n=1 Tax=Microbacterium sp. TaxID=51671 RepID=UPI003A8F4DFD
MTDNSRFAPLGRVFGRASIAYRRAFLRSALILLLISLIAAIVTVAAFSFMVPLARLQLPFMLDAAGIGVTPTGFTLLFVEVAIPGALVVALLAGMGQVALVRVLDDARSKHAMRMGAALVHGARYSLPAAVALLTIFLTVALLAVATPLLTALGAIGLLAALIAKLARRQLPISTWWFVAALIPFGLAAVVAVRWSTAVAVIALEGHGPFAALRRSAALTRPFEFVVAAALFVSFTAYFLLQFAIGLLALAGIPSALMSSVSLLAQVCTFGFPLAVIVELTRTLRDSRHQIVPLPRLRRSLRFPVTAVTVSAALLVGFIQVVPLAPAAQASTEQAYSAEGEEGAEEPPTEQPPAEEPPAEEPPAEEPPAEEPPAEEPPAEEPPGTDTGQLFNFRPVLTVLEGELTAPGAPITLDIQATTVDDGQIPYTFFIVVYLLDENDDQIFVGRSQAAGGGREAEYSLDHLGLEVGEHRILVETSYKANREVDEINGPALTITHHVGVIDSSTRVALSASATEIYGDESVLLSATVTGDTGPAIFGNVTFQDASDSSVAPVTVEVDGNGAAEATFSGLGVGAHRFEAVYRYPNAGVITQPADVTATVLRYPVTLTLGAAAHDSEHGQSAEFPFTLRDLRGGPHPAGTIELVAGAEVLGQVTIPQGLVGTEFQGSLSTDQILVGTHTLSAQFISSDGQHEDATSLPVTHSVDAVNVMLSIDSSNGWEMPRGSSTTLTVGVEVAPGSDRIPTGTTLTVTVGADVRDFVLQGSEREVSLYLEDVRGNSGGKVEITATLSGSTTHTATQETAEISMRAAVPSIQLLLVTPGAPGTAQGFEAYIAGETAVRPTDGRLQVRLKGTTTWQTLTVGTDNPVPFSMSLGLGEHVIQARYLSDRPGEFADTDITETTFMVRHVATQLTAHGPTTHPRVGEEYQIVVDVAEFVHAPTGGPAGDIIVERTEGTRVASGTISAGTVTITIPGAGLGDDELLISYPGSRIHGSSSTSLSVLVRAWSSTTSLVANPASTTVGEATELTATVTSQVPAALTALTGGEVEFSVDDQAVGTAVIGADGTAKLAIVSPMTTGSHTVKARFIGVTGIVGESSMQSTLEVSTATTSLEVSVSPDALISREIAQVTVRVSVDPRSPATASGGTVTLTGSLLGSQPTQIVGADGTTTFTVVAPYGAGELFDVSARYSGTAELAAASASTSVRVNAAPVELGIGGVDRITVGEQANIAVDLSIPGSIPVPTSGAIDLFAGDTLISSKTLSQGSGSTVNFTLSAPGSLAIGDHLLTARFSGAYGYLEATSPEKSFTVLGRETETLLLVSPSGSTPRGTTFTATVRVDVLWTSDRPAGRIWLYNGDTVVRQTFISDFDGDRGVAAFAIDDLPIGAYDLRAEYVANDGMNANSTSALAQHEVTGRTVSLAPVFGALSVGQDATVIVDVRDLNATGGSAPEGDVDILLGGSAVGTGWVVPGASGSLTSQATVTIPFMKLLGGVQKFTVMYRSYDGIHSFAETSVTVPVEKLTPVLRVTPQNIPSEIQWGDELRVQVNAFPSSAPGASSLPLPSGALTVTLSDRTPCALDGIDYRCTPERPGLVTVEASIAADTNYVARETSVALGTASKRTPALTVNVTYPGVNTAELETGTPVRVDWHLDGPGVRPTLSGIPQGAICRGDATGYCEFSYGLAAAGAVQKIRAEYPGNELWNAATTWQQSLTPLACYPLIIRTNSSAMGTLSLATVDGPKCTNGDFRAGTKVAVRATPAASDSPGWRYELMTVSNRKADTAVGGLFWFTVGKAPGQTTDIYADFAKVTACYPVTLQQISATGGPLSSHLTFGQQPNCPGVPELESSPGANVDGLRSTAVVGWFVGGTVLAPAANTTQGEEFYAARMAGSSEPAVNAALNATLWQQRMPGAFTVHEAVSIQAQFGDPCLPVSLTAEGAGRVSATSAPNCADAFRPDEYRQGTEVVWDVVPDPTVFGFVADAASAGSFSLSDDPADHLLGVGSFTMRALPGGNTAMIRFSECHTLTVDNLTPDRNSVAASASNCPVGAPPAEGTWRYRSGSAVDVWTTRLRDQDFQLRFISWNHPDAASNPAIADEFSRASASFTIDSSLTLRPAYMFRDECTPLTVGPGAPGIEVQVDPDSARGVSKCDKGDLLTGWTTARLAGETTKDQITIAARSTTGNPQLGWVVGGSGTSPVPSVGTGTRGSTVHLTESGNRTLTAYACQEVSPYVGITDVTGEPRIALQRTGTFIEISPAPNCPFNSNAWLIGTDLTFTAGADERGYEFGVWGGVAEVSTDDPRTASYTVDATAPTVAVTAAYAVLCHTLTVSGKAHRVTQVPQPNCPGAPAGGLDENNVYTGHYIGGTAVALFGEVPGGNIWQGWSGDLEETGKVKVAVAIMDADKAAEHRYRGKSWDEKAADFFTEAGNQLAVAAKKALGGVAYVAGTFMQEVPPASLLGESFEMLSLVGDLLNRIGVPTSVTKYFSYPSQALDWMYSGFTCVASASLSSQGGGASRDVSQDTSSAEKSAYDTVGSGFKAIGIDTGDNSAALSQALSDLYLAGKITGKLGQLTGVGAGVDKAMSAVDTGLEVYNIVNGPQGVGWDGSASDAWDSDMGDHIAGCMAAATPDFLRDAVPISNTDFERFDEDYGL